MPQVTSLKPARAAQLATPATAWWAWLLLACAPLPLVAQFVAGGGDGFRFSPSIVSVTVRGGFDRPMAQSEIFDFTTTNLTIARNDFSSFSGAADIAVRVRPRLDVIVGVGRAQRRIPSEFRKFIDNNDRPIEQVTTLRRVPVTLGVRYALRPPGERISTFAWIPARFTPWIGAGGGVMNYRFAQTGDFVNFTTFAVFKDSYAAKGNAPMAYANVAAEFMLSTRIALTSDIRYSVACGTLGGSFERFDKIDLSGAAATMGLTLRY